MLTLHAAVRSATWLLVLLVVTIGGASTAPHLLWASPLRTADGLWRAGRVTEAWALYTQLNDQAQLPPHAQLRLAGLALARGACGDAELLAAQALNQQITRDDAAVAHVIRAECAIRREALDSATAAWNNIDHPSPLGAVAQVLQGEHALQRGETTTAIEHFGTALRHDLPAPWAALAQLRLAQTSDDPRTARDHLAAIPTVVPAPDPMLRPLLPVPPRDIDAQAASLQAIVDAPAADYAQLRGQQLLDAGLWHGAAAQFDQLAAADGNAPYAPAYAAYARYQIGERRAATNALRTLYRRFPTDPLVATLYATFTLQNNQPNTAAAIVERAAAEHPGDPAVAIVRSDVFAAQRRYADALAERRRALAMAPADQRPRYARAVVQQHLDLAYKLCSDGVTAAQEATALAPNDGQAWQLLATVYSHCGRTADTITAAQQGLAYAPNDPALRFLLGSALWEAGRRNEGRTSLIKAADLAPNSEWRERAEQLLQIEDGR